MGGKSAAEKASESVFMERTNPFEFRRDDFTRSLKEDQDVAESREMQGELSEALAARARGDVESLAERQFRASQDRLLAQQAAAQAGLRGRGGALAGREMARMAAEQQQAGARDAATIRAQEQMGAERALASQLQAQRAADIGVAQQDRQAQQRLQELQAQQALSASAQNIQRGQQALQHEEQFGGSFLDTLGGIAKGVATVGGALSDETKKRNIKKSEGSASSFLDALTKVTKTVGDTTDAIQGKKSAPVPRKKESSPIVRSGLGSLVPAKSGSPAAKAEKVGGFRGVASDIGSVASVIGGALGKSDKESKININVGGGQPAKEFLDALTAYQYEYKDPKELGAGEGEQLGIMAQELEEAGPVGEQMVIDTPQGKMVDYGKGFGAILAAQVELNERLKELEKRKKKG